MPRELVPELHDILKLTILKHNFSDFDPFQSLAPKTNTWRGVLQHHCDESFPAYPSDRETFLLHIADGLASQFSRHPQNIQKDVNWMVHRLWNPHRAVDDKRLRDPEEIRKLLEAMGTDPSFEEFYLRYEEIFRTRAEDAHPGMNVTTLETHVRLVGRFYRFLLKSRNHTVTDNEVLTAATRGVEGIAELRKKKSRDWHLYILHCHIRLLTNPFRARDMNAFGGLQEFLDEIKENLGDRLLFSSTDELLLYSDSLDLLEELRARAEPKGIVLEVQRDLQRLDMLNLNFRKPEFEAIYPALKAEIAPPLCEICQLSRATKVWPEDYLTSKGIEPGVDAEGKDLLCETCFQIRSHPSRLKKLANWEGWAAGELVWIRFGLDFGKLRTTLERLYLEYLRSLDLNTPEEKATIRFSLIAEFQCDYERFLAQLTTSLEREFGRERLERILPDLFCIQAQTGTDALTVLRCFLNSTQEYFPAFLGVGGSPLKVSLTYSDVKHPFFETWRQWQSQEAEMEVTAVGHGSLQLEISNLERFLQLAEYPFRLSSLHNLAQISLVSQRLAELRFRSATEKGERDTFDHLKQFLPLGLTFDGILTLAMLAQG